MNSPVDRPMFHDIGGALLWAWYGSVEAANTVKGPAWAQYQKDDERDQIANEVVRLAGYLSVGGVPRGYMAAGQAGAIKRHVMRMPGDEGCHLMAKYLRGRERIMARKHLRRFVAAHVGARGDDRRALGILLAGHYGRKRVSVSAVAEAIGADRRRVGKLHRRMIITLDALALRAERRIYTVLQERGLIL